MYSHEPSWIYDLSSVVTIVAYISNQLGLLCILVFRADHLGVRNLPGTCPPQNWFFFPQQLWIPCSYSSRSRDLGNLLQSLLASQLVWSLQVLCWHPFCWEFTGTASLSCLEDIILQQDSSSSGSFNPPTPPPQRFLLGCAVDTPIRDQDSHFSLFSVLWPLVGLSSGLCQVQKKLLGWE